MAYAQGNLNNLAALAHSDDKCSYSSAASTISHMTDSDYAKVIFHAVKDVYSVHEDIECHFEVTTFVNPQPNDYIGLFVVGWKDVSQCCASVRFSEAKVNTTSHGISYFVIFRAENLPKEEHEFYQFFYLTETNSIRGASTPFQLQSSGDDLVIVGTEDDFLVVRSKLYEKSVMLERELKERTEYIQTLENEKSVLSEELRTAKDANSVLINTKQADVATERELTAKLNAKEKEIADQLHTIQSLQSELLDAKLLIEKLRSNIDLLAAENEKKGSHEEFHAANLSEIEAEKILFKTQLEETISMLNAQEMTKLLIKKELSDEKEKNSELRTIAEELKIENETLGKCLEQTRVELEKTREQLKQKDIESDLEEKFKKLMTVSCNAAMENLLTEMNALKLTLAEQNQKLEKYKNECLEKDEIIDSLQKEKADLIKSGEIAKLQLLDLRRRLQEAADIYRKQYLEIHNLKKQLRRSSDVSSKFSGSSTCSSSASSVVSDNFSLLDRDNLDTHCNISSRNSDSDTGEHVSHNLNGNKQTLRSSVELEDLKILHCSLEHPPLKNAGVQCQPPQISSASQISHEGFESIISEHANDKDQFLSFDCVKNVVPLCNSQVSSSIASTSSIEVLSDAPSTSSRSNASTVQLPLCTPSVTTGAVVNSVTTGAVVNSVTTGAVENSVTNTPMDADLINFSAPVPEEKSAETVPKEKVFTLPCSLCNRGITVFSNDCSAMVEHLKHCHNQQLCPVCGSMFDLSLPSKYFAFHVENHFIQKPKA